ncbi:class I SAM-dependent RNA methyltransferase [Methylobacterium radiotolerans]|uniref:class I SAM-dependent RNA methyltransferase n=1 Tax=Methylobacterium TaxID=407 RepID=UPI0005E86BF2|nr:class I SAM-dependent RNA methyltransferase [Methylobacterium radiotolerans]MBN6821944.1 class I SAM-dependent RNA methyltransferase [Methylobacterium organophilum]OXE43886.1 class I SAM-dependent RNA methyltransferase [Methylobacterium radiotolerans]GAN50076.1 uracil-5-methyltransferase [Methylobacterium sp. ME121]
MSEPANSETVTIRALGARGDGIAEDGTLVPYTLPGERAEIRREARRGVLLGVAQASPDRVEPFCPYYMRCGGCRTQHLARPAELAWKRDLVAQALSQARLDVTPGPTLDAHGAGRRRLTLHVREIGGRAEAGLMAARSHALVPIDHCPITVPALHPAPEVARRLAAPLGHGRKPLDVAVTATDQGLDVDLRGHGPVSAGVGAALVRIAGELGLARLSLHGERLMEAEPVSVTAGDPAGGTSGAARLYPAPGGFLQATAAGQATLCDLTLAALGPRVRRVADLFAGCGPLTLAIARTAAVHAVESDAAALAGLDRAARAASGLRRITSERRDLFRRPLLPTELDPFDAVVFDPPRAGAEAQARQIAAARVPLVIGVACDAGTFARDAATLVAGGYRLETVTPVDQFRHSGHVEMVGVFRREPGRRR